MRRLARRQTDMPPKHFRTDIINEVVTPLAGNPATCVQRSPSYGSAAPIHRESVDTLLTATVSFDYDKARNCVHI